VVLPTHSLAVQVHSVLHSLGSAAGVTVALAAAQEGVAAEAAKLVAHPSQPGSGPHVLVATPGRLMAHLQANAGGLWSSSSSSSSSVLSLQHLKFLVVDEADRLLRQDYHGWLPQVLEHIHTLNSSTSRSGVVSSQQPLSLLPLQPTAHQHAAAGAAAVVHSSSSAASHSSMISSGGDSSSASSRVLKLIVSATLTRDPSKLMRLELCCPRYIALTDVSRRYTLPAALEQFRLVVPAQHKPLAMVGLLHRLGQARTVVFASSLDMTHRCAHGLGWEWRSSRWMNEAGCFSHKLALSKAASSCQLIVSSSNQPCVRANALLLVPATGSTLSVWHAAVCRLFCFCLQAVSAAGSSTRPTRCRSRVLQPCCTRRAPRSLVSFQAGPRHRPRNIGRNGARDGR
jgi:ATP-dependent RNA helicase DDX51/DBP6